MSTAEYNAFPVKEYMVKQQFNLKVQSGHSNLK